VNNATTTIYVGPFGGGGWRIRSGDGYGQPFATRDQAVRQATEMALAYRAKGGWVEVQVLGDDNCYHPHAIEQVRWRR